MRDSPALPAGSQGTSTSFSSSSSVDGDLDFQSPEGSQGHRPGKGELAGLRLGVDSGEGQEAPPRPPPCVRRNQVRPSCPVPAAERPGADAAVGADAGPVLGDGGLF